ncbi:MAG: hypothetical protein ACK5SZ_01195, partial [bacterium]
VSAEGHFTTMYFDADGQQLSVVKSLTHPATASEFKIFETTRDQDGFVIYRGTPRAAAGYQHLSGQISRRESGGLALLTPRVPTGVYRGFVASQRLDDGGLNVAPLASYSYLGESDASLTVSMGVGGGGEYEIYRPLIAGVTRFEDVEGSSPLTTSLSYRMDSELAPRGSPLAVRIVTQRDPVVTRDRHGDGAPRISHMMLDHDGTPLLRRFPSGRIDAISRDDHWLITSTIKDCDPLRLPAMPMLPEFQPDIGATALHRVTRFEYDLQGRLRASVQGGLGSNAERRHELYRDVLADGRMVRFDIPHVDAGF